MTTAPPGTALAWLDAAAEERDRRGLHRKLTPRLPGPDSCLDLAGNDYLGLSRHPAVVAAATAALQQYGAGSTGSRLVTGTTALHEDLEAALARFCQAPAALVFSSGYTANLAAVTALTGPGSLVVSSRSNHASLVDACRLSRARVVVAPDDDIDAVRRVLSTREEPRAVLVTDAVFSVDGRVSRLAELHAVARDTGTAMIVDEAHALGVVGPSGRGACVQAGVADDPDVVRTITLSKALGGQGGAVLSSQAVRDQLVDTGRSFIFDTGLAPASAGAALAALALVTPDRVRSLHHNAAELAGLLGLRSPSTAVLSVLVGDAHRASAARDACLARGVRVGCFRPPSVPNGRACLRLTVRSDLTAAHLARAASAVAAALPAVR